MSNLDKEFSQYIEKNYSNQTIEIIHTREVNDSLRIFLILIPDNNKLIFEIISVLSSYITSANRHFETDVRVEYSKGEDGVDLLADMFEKFDNVYKKRWIKQSL